MTARDPGGVNAAVDNIKKLQNHVFLASSKIWDCFVGLVADSDIVEPKVLKKIASTG